MKKDIEIIALQLWGKWALNWEYLTKDLFLLALQDERLLQYFKGKVTKKPYMTIEEIKTITEKHFSDLHMKFEDSKQEHNTKVGFRMGLDYSMITENWGSSWVSVNRALPILDHNHNSIHVLCLTQTKLIEKGYLHLTEWETCYSPKTFKELGYIITHWRPLPEPPKK